MSRENVKNFYEKLKVDKNLAQELMKLKEELEKGDKKFLNDEYVINEKIIPLAKKHGISFTADEFTAYTNDQLKELSEEDLLNVSGGVNVFNAAGRVLFTLISALNPLGYGTNSSAPLTANKPEQVIVSQQGEKRRADNVSVSKNTKRELKNKVLELERGGVSKPLTDEEYDAYMELFSKEYPRFSREHDVRLYTDFGIAERAQFKEDSKKFSKELEDFKEENDRKLEKVQNELNASKKENNALKQKNEVLEEKIKKEGDEAESRNINLKQENDKLKAQLNGLRSELGKAREANRSEYERGRKDCKADIENREKLKLLLKKSNDETEKNKLEQLKPKIAKEDAELGKNKNEREALRSQIKQNEESFNTEKQNIKNEYEQNIKDLNEALVERYDEINSLRKAVADNIQQKEELNGELESKTTEIAKINQALAAQKAEAERVQAELNEQIESLKNTNEQQSEKIKQAVLQMSQVKEKNEKLKQAAADRENEVKQKIENAKNNVENKVKQVIQQREETLKKAMKKEKEQALAAQKAEAERVKAELKKQIESLKNTNKQQSEWIKQVGTEIAQVKAGKESAELKKLITQRDELIKKEKEEELRALEIQYVDQIENLSNLCNEAQDRVKFLEKELEAKNQKLEKLKDNQ